MNTHDFDIMFGGDTAPFHRDQYDAKMQRYPSDAGIDLYPRAIVKTDHFIKTGMRQMYVSTGLHILFPHGVYGALCGRSSSIIKLEGCGVVPSVIDAGFTGELLVRVLIPSGVDVLLAAGCCIQECIDNKVAIAQVVPTRVLYPRVCGWDEQLASMMARGCNGFGSSDKHPDHRIAQADQDVAGFPI